MYNMLMVESADENLASNKTDQQKPKGVRVTFELDAEQAKNLHAAIQNGELKQFGVTKSSLVCLFEDEEAREDGKEMLHSNLINHSDFLHIDI